MIVRSPLPNETRVFITNDTEHVSEHEISDDKAQLFQDLPVSKIIIVTYLAITH